MSFLKTEFQRLLDKHGVDYKESNTSFIMTCPRCDKAKKLWVLKHNGYFVCWSCKETDNFQGRVEIALSEILNRPLSEIRPLLYHGEIPTGAELNLDLSAFGSDDEYVNIQGPPTLDIIDWPIDVVTLDSKYGEKGRAYLLGRGISLAQAELYDIRYWPNHKRVVFPVKRNGELYGYQARSIVKGVEPKILTSTGLRREHILMFEDNLKLCDHAIICEGPVDALKIASCRGAVATMGKAVSKSQLEIIRKHGIKKVFLALDPDAADEAARLAKELGDMETRLVLPPYGKKDLGECSYDEGLKAFRSAKLFSAGNLLFGLRMPARFA